MSSHRMSSADAALIAASPLAVPGRVAAELAIQINPRLFELGEQVVQIDTYDSKTLADLRMFALENLGYAIDAIRTAGEILDEIERRKR